MPIDDCVAGSKIPKKEVEEDSATYQRLKRLLEPVKVYSEEEEEKNLAQRTGSMAALRMRYVLPSGRYE